MKRKDVSDSVLENELLSKVVLARGDDDGGCSSDDLPYEFFVRLRKLK